MIEHSRTDSVVGLNCENVDAVVLVETSSVTRVAASTLPNIFAVNDLDQE